MLDQHVIDTLLVRDFVDNLDLCLRNGHVPEGASVAYDTARERCHHIWAVMTPKQRKEADEAFSKHVTKT